MTNLVVVGGGTAGWITALFAQVALPESNITLVESDKIGILGAGEGTTPDFISLLSYIGIDTADLITECYATLKTGLKFTGWNPERDYHFPFPGDAGIGEQIYRFTVGTLATSMSAPISARLGRDFREYDLLHKMAELGLSPMYERGFSEEQDIVDGVGSLASWAIHFDARELAAYLRKVGESRGIVRIEGLLGDIKTDNDGYISSIYVGEQKIETDFVFDATGFARMIIGKFYNAPWKSHQKHLPVNRAIPFFLDSVDNPPAYTEAVSMDYGWMWKIPLQHRFGCGYVFDSNRISDDEAKDEIEKVIGHSVEPPTAFSFDAGCYTTPLVKNVLAVGLAAGFVEPLEATSLWQLSRSLHRFFGARAHMTSRSDAAYKAFNRASIDETDAIVSFLYMHYVTNRKGDFWQNYVHDTEMPELVSELLEVSKVRPLYNELDFVKKIAFNESDFTTIMVGSGLISRESLSLWDISEPERNIERYLEMVENVNASLEVLMTHGQFLERCRMGNKSISVV